MNSLPMGEARGSQCVRRMAIKHVKELELSDELKQNARFRGIEVSIVELMGWVHSAKDISNGGKKFTLVDGTESITCMIWGGKNSSHIKNGAFIKAVGSIGRYDQGDIENLFTCTATAPVQDGNNVVYHLLMRIVHSLDVKKSVERRILESIENSPMGEREQTTKHLGNFQQVHLDILSYFSNNQGETGLNVAMVTSTLVSSGYYPKKEIESGIAYLIDAGKLFYCTEDKKMLALVE